MSRMSRTEDIRFAIPEDDDYSLGTAADRLAHTHLKLVKTAWQRDQEELKVQINAVDQLREELSNLCSVTELQIIRGDMGILFSNNTRNPNSFVDFIEHLLPRHYLGGIRLKCCLRSGESWIIVGSDNSVRRLTDAAFDHAVSTMEVSRIYHIKQLMTLSDNIANDFGGENGGVLVVPVFPMICFWLLEKETVNPEGIQYHNPRRFVSMIPTAESINESSHINSQINFQNDFPNSYNSGRISADEELERIYRAAVFLTGTFFSILEDASQYCISSLVNRIEGHQLDASVSNSFCITFCYFSKY
jgi:hypothetical protein